MLTFPVLLAALMLAPAPSGSDPDISGTWTFVPARSTDLATWRYRVPSLTIHDTRSSVTIALHWIEGKRIASVDSFQVTPGGPPTRIVVTSPLWPENWYMGVLAKEGSTRTVTGRWIEGRSALRVVSDQVVRVSQGETTIRTTQDFRLSQGDSTLTVTEHRSTRPTPVVLVFERAK